MQSGADEEVTALRCAGVRPTSSSSTLRGLSCTWPTIRTGCDARVDGHLARPGARGGDWLAMSSCVRCRQGVKDVHASRRSMPRARAVGAERPGRAGLGPRFASRGVRGREAWTNSARGWRGGRPAVSAWAWWEVGGADGGRGASPDSCDPARQRNGSSENRAPVARLWRAMSGCVRCRHRLKDVHASRRSMPRARAVGAKRPGRAGLGPRFANRAVRGEKRGRMRPGGRRGGGAGGVRGWRGGRRAVRGWWT
jgi:hypothetical protein